MYIVYYVPHGSLTNRINDVQFTGIRDHLKRGVKNLNATQND